MKVITVLGTRPEIIRLSRIIPKLDNTCEHILINTGQNYDPDLNASLFSELGIREPDYNLGVRGNTLGEQVGAILVSCEKVIRDEKPDRLLILGDTNSSLSSIIAKRYDVKVFHMEAGNRCYDDRVPEEVNRRIIDHTSDILMPYTERSRKNLLGEGVASERIFVTGNPIFEVIEHYKKTIQKSGILKKLGIGKNRYILVTLHRSENVDSKERLATVIDSLVQVQKKYDMPVICSTHPRTRDKLQTFRLVAGNDKVQFHQPFGFFDFIHLEENAFCVLSDSGTVQEECCLFHVPNVTLRDVTERPETVECGSNILSGVEPEDVLRCVNCVTKEAPDWTIPTEYLESHVSNTVTKIVCGFFHDQ